VPVCAGAGRRAVPSCIRSARGAGWLGRAVTRRGCEVSRGLWSRTIVSVLGLGSRWVFRRASRGGRVRGPWLMLCAMGGL
jgi:hypothetical protein